MSALPAVYVDGVGFWAPALPCWPAAASAMRDEAASAASAAPAVAAAPATRPAAARLPPNERRRAPDAVLLAVEAAQAAVLESGFDATELASVFTSAHGDLAVIDALCSTLAGNPLLLSPTRFHHSVHNAASGYWAIASGSHLGSTALAGYDHSFGAGLLEALSLCAADGAPVLLVGADTAARGPMASVNTSRGLLGVALVLSPRRGPRSRFVLEATVAAGKRASLPQSAAAQALGGNALADALPLFEALALERTGKVHLAVGCGSALTVSLEPLVGALGEPSTQPRTEPPIQPPTSSPGA